MIRYSVLFLLLWSPAWGDNLFRVNHAALPDYGVFNGPVERLAPGTLIDLHPETGRSSSSTCFGAQSVSVRLHSLATGKDFTLPVLRGEYVPCEVRAQAMIPSDAPLGAAELSFQADNDLYGPAKIEIVATRFAPFQDFRNTSGFPVSLSSSAPAGQELIVRGTGAGSAKPGDLSGTIGTQPVEVMAVTHTDASGIDEVRFRLPASLDWTGCYVPFRLGEPQTVFLAATNEGGLCPHPLGLNPSQLAALDAGRSIAWVEYGSGGLSAIYASASILRARFAQPAEGCSWEPRVDSPATTKLETGKIAFLEPDSQGGNSLQVGASKDLLPFSIYYRNPAPIQLRSFDPAVPLDPAKDFTIEWNGSGYEWGDVVTARLNPGAGSRPTLACRAPARNGTMKIPLAVWATAYPLKPGEGADLVVDVGRAADWPFTFDVELVNGGRGAGSVSTSQSAWLSLSLVGGAK